MSLFTLRLVLGAELKAVARHQEAYVESSPLWLPACDATQLNIALVPARYSSVNLRVPVLAACVISVTAALTAGQRTDPVADPFVVIATPFDGAISGSLVADAVTALGPVEWEWVSSFEKTASVEGLKQVEQGYSTDPRRSPMCHQLVHELGRRTYRALNSVSDAVAIETGWCGGGFTHGVFEEWARHVDVWDADINLVEVCGDIRPEICGHGIGHAMMQVQPQLSEAFNRCESLPKVLGWDCIEGVLMLFTQSYLRPHPDDPRFNMGFSIRSLCDTVPAVFAEQCEWTAGATWPGVTGNPDRVRALYQCLDLIRGPLSPIRCAWGVGNIIPDVTGWDVDAGVDICEQAPPSLVEACVSGFVWVLSGFAKSAGKPGNICDTAKLEEVRDRCRTSAAQPSWRDRDAAGGH